MSLDLTSLLVNAAVAASTWLLYSLYLTVQSSWGSHQQNLQTINQNIIRNGSVTETYRKELDTKVEELTKTTTEAKNLIALLVNYFNTLESNRQQQAGETTVADKNPAPPVRSVQQTRPDTTNVRQTASPDVQQYMKPQAPAVVAAPAPAAEPATAPVVEEASAPEKPASVKGSKAK